MGTVGTKRGINTHLANPVTPPATNLFCISCSSLQQMLDGEPVEVVVAEVVWWSGEKEVVVRCGVGVEK